MDKTKMMEKEKRFVERELSALMERTLNLENELEMFENNNWNRT